MSEVKRYNFFCSDRIEQEGRNSDFVRASDYDAAQSQLAALREELESFKQGAKAEADAGDEARREVHALREELADMQRWRDLALQFDNHRMTALWHLKTLVLNPGYSPAVTDFLAEPPLPAHEVVRRLADAERRNESLSGLLRETSDYLDGSTRNAVWCDSILHKKMKAALNKPTESGAGE